MLYANFRFRYTGPWRQPNECVLLNLTDLLLTHYTVVSEHASVVSDVEKAFDTIRNN